MRKHLQYLEVTGLLCIVMLLAVGCKANDRTDLPLPTKTKDVKTTVTPTPDPVGIVKVDFKEDPSFLDVFNEDPYLQTSCEKEERETFDRDLYNYLYKAMLNSEKIVDISAFKDVPREKKINTIVSLGVGAFHNNHFYYAGYSEDLNTAILHYNKDEKDNSESDIIYWTQYNHMIYNVAPSNYTQYQRFFAVYDYICKYADYTGDMQDESTLSVYSVLTKKKGICGSFSSLAYRVLNQVDVPTEIISNEAHAWNIVELGGTRFHTDVTWGVGLSNTNESLINTALMNDDDRMEGIEAMGFGELEIHKGFIGESEYKPCMDSRYEFLKDIYVNYSLDIDNSYIYYSIGDEVERINLDSTGRVTIFEEYGDLLTCYNGILYFRSWNDSKLYRYTPGEEVELVDDSIMIKHMKIENGILIYGPGDGTKADKKIDLNPFRKSQFSKEMATLLEQKNIKKEQTFSVDIQFNHEMDTTCIPYEQIGLVTGSNITLPIHLVWSKDKKTLTIRSKACIINETVVSLYIKEGIKSADGSLTKENQILNIQYK